MEADADVDARLGGPRGVHGEPVEQLREVCFLDLVVHGEGDGGEAQRDGRGAGGGRVNEITFPVAAQQVAQVEGGDVLLRGGELVVQLFHHLGELLVFPVAAGEHALGDGDVFVRGLVAGQTARVDGDGGQDQLEELVVDVVFLWQGFKRVEKLAGDDGGARCDAFEDAGGGFGRNTAVLVVVEDAEDLCVPPLAQRLAVVYEDDAFELRG